LISSEQTPFYVANSASPPDNKSRTDFELSVLIEVLPARVRNLLQQHPDLPQLVEVVLDLGRPVLARFANTDQLLSAAPLAKQELEEVTSKARHLLAGHMQQRPQDSTTCLRVCCTAARTVS